MLAYSLIFIFCALFASRACALPPTLLHARIRFPTRPRRTGGPERALLPLALLLRS